MTPSRMPSIPHFTQASFAEMQRFLHPFNGNPYMITEKVDGINLSICNINNQIYLKTKKGELIRNPQEFTDLSKKYETPAMQDIAQLLTVLLKYEEDIIRMWTMDPQIFFEFIPNIKPNVIEYSPKYIGAGALYFFDSIDSTLDRALCGALDDYNLYDRNEISPKDIKIAQTKAFDELIVFFKHNCEVMLSRKQDTVSVSKKANARKEYQQLLEIVNKSVILQFSNVKSKLGAKNIEGIVVSNICNGTRVKFVDLEDFGEKRATMWAGVDEIKSLRKQLFKDIIDVLNKPDILLIEKKQEQKFAELYNYQRHTEEYILYTLEQEFLKEYTGTYDYIERCVNLISIYFDNLLKIPNNSEKAHTAIKAEIQIVCSLLEQLKIKTDATQNLIKFIVGYKRINELISQF